MIQEKRTFLFGISVLSILIILGLIPMIIRYVNGPGAIAK